MQRIDFSDAHADARKDELNGPHATLNNGPFDARICNLDSQFCVGSAGSKRPQCLATGMRNSGENQVKTVFLTCVVALVLPAIGSLKPTAIADRDESIVAALDTEYQAAVKKNDAKTMDRILADDFVLVTGRGKTLTKTDLLNEARARNIVYERQEDSNQTVRIWGNTAVVTALLWAKGTNQGKPFEYKLWFSDTYVRTSNGWRYVFGQASIPLPKE